MSTIQAPPYKAPVPSNLVYGHHAAESNGVMLTGHWHHSNDPAVIDG